MPSSNTRFPMWLVLLAAAGTFALTMGVRQSMGLFMSPINSATELGVANISLAFAFGQLWWGLTQPFAGMFADRVGTGRVLFAGILFITLGTCLTPFMHSTGGLVFTIGVLAGGGAGMAGPSVLMAATTRLLPANRRGMATGIVNAGGSFGQFVMAPLAGFITALADWVTSLLTLGILVLLGLPAAWILRGNSLAAAATTGASPGQIGIAQAVRTALSDRSYLCLCAGFFVCGFHVAFLATHLPGVVASCQLSLQVGAWSLAILGLFNIVGSISMGWAVGRWRMKSLLSLLYSVRALAILVFVLAPKNEIVMLIFAAAMGLTFLSTVPPTAGLVARLYGPENMATLFGIVMLAHQIGGFTGAYMGGKVFEMTGNYDWMWYADIVLAIGAAFIHMPIREAAIQRAALASA